MNTLVLLKMVPDVVEELEVAPDGKSLETEFLRMTASESDDHALEEALLLKERHGGTVTVLALDAPEVDDVLFSALAKGADRAIKVDGVEPGLSTNVSARAVAQIIEAEPGLSAVDLVLTGAQAIDDLDGLMAPLISHYLGLPCVGIVTEVSVDTGARLATVIREFPNSIRGRYEVPLPAVLGIQAAEKPPRYVPVAKVRAAMKSQSLDTIPAATMADGGLGLVEVVQMSKPETAAQAQILEGQPEEVSAKICGILSERGLL